MFLMLVLGAAALASAATKVLVLPLRSVGEPGNYDWISQAVAEDLQSDARQNPGVQVLPAPQTPVDATSAAALTAGKTAGADITIFGSFQVVGDMLRINCTAIDTTGQTLTSPAATGAVRDLFVIEDKLASEFDRVLPARPGADPVPAAQTPVPAPVPYTLTNPGTFTLPGVTDTPSPAPAPSPASQASPEYYYSSTPYVYYLPEYSMPPVYYPDDTSYCYTTCEPYYGGIYVVPTVSYYGGFNGIYGNGGFDRGRGGGNFTINGGGRTFATPGRVSTGGGMRTPLSAPTPPWGNAPTPLGFRNAPIGAAGNPAHFNTGPIGGGGGFGGRR
jgi:TolB-like protein